MLKLLNKMFSILKYILPYLYIFLEIISMYLATFIFIWKGLTKHITTVFPANCLLAYKEKNNSNPILSQNYTFIKWKALGMPIRSVLGEDY